MRFFGVVLFFAGYVLAYASVARGGVLATDPWAALWIDAYTGETTGDIPTTFTTNKQGDVIATFQTALGTVRRNMGLSPAAQSGIAGNPGMVSGPPPKGRRRLGPNSPIPRRNLGPTG